MFTPVAKTKARSSCNVPKSWHCAWNTRIQDDGRRQDIQLHDSNVSFVKTKNKSSKIEFWTQMPPNQKCIIIRYRHRQRKQQVYDRHDQLPIQHRAPVSLQVHFPSLAGIHQSIPKHERTPPDSLSFPKSAHSQTTCSAPHPATEICPSPLYRRPNAPKKAWKSCRTAMRGRGGSHGLAMADTHSKFRAKQ